MVTKPSADRAQRKNIQSEFSESLDGSETRDPRAKSDLTWRGNPIATSWVGTCENPSRRESAPARRRCAKPGFSFLNGAPARILNTLARDFQMREQPFERCASPPTRAVSTTTPNQNFPAARTPNTLSKGHGRALGAGTESRGNKLTEGKRSKQAISFAI
jgi:hypothetical protein